jgi:hypothetical protein
MHIYVIVSVGVELDHLYPGVVGYFLTAPEADKIALQHFVIIYIKVDAAILMPAFPAGFAQLHPVFIISIYPFQQPVKMKGVFGIGDEISRKTKRDGIVFKGLFDKGLKRLFDFGVGEVVICLSQVFPCVFEHIALAYLYFLSLFHRKLLQSIFYNFCCIIYIHFIFKVGLIVKVNRNNLIVIFSGFLSQCTNAGTANKASASCIIYLYHSITCTARTGFSITKSEIK